MELKVNIRDKQVKRFFDRLKARKPTAFKKSLLEASQFQRGNITRRTLKGLDFQGRNFAPYTPEYADFRRQAGRPLRPDLNFTGQMLGAMTIEASPSRGRIFFTRTAEGTKALGNDKKRPFFAISRKDEVKIAEIFVDRLLRELGV
jgi:hypothetical protein